MRYSPSRIVSYCWFCFVLWITGGLPDLKVFMWLRGFLVRPCFRKCGRNFQIGAGTHIKYTNRITVGDDVYIACNCWIQGVGEVVLEDQAMLGPFVVLATNDHGKQDGSYRYGPPRRGRITMCRGAWAGAHAVLTRGVTIGAGAAVGANAVVTRDVPAHCVVAGVPAKVIHRDDEGGETLAAAT